MHILSPVTDNCSSWISGRGRMAVEMFSWPSLLEKMFGLAPIFDAGVTFGEKWHQKLSLWYQIDILTSCTSHLTPPATFPSPGRVHGNSGRVCKKMSWVNMINGWDITFKIMLLNMWQYCHKVICKELCIPVIDQWNVPFHQRSWLGSLYHHQRSGNNKISEILYNYYKTPEYVGLH